MGKGRETLTPAIMLTKYIIFLLLLLVILVVVFFVRRNRSLTSFPGSREGLQCFYCRYVKGVPFSIGSMQKGYLFDQKWYMKG